jgi:hypothetical protein
MNEPVVATFQWAYGVYRKAWIDGEHLFIEWDTQLYTGTTFKEIERINLDTWEAHRYCDFVEVSKTWEQFTIPDCDHPYYNWVKGLVTKARDALGKE